MKRLGRPTGPKPGFASDDVIAAALDLGVDSFTLSSVAKRLGVATSALYRIVSSREDLLDMCLRRIAGQADFAIPVAPWPEVARECVERMWRLLEDHPGLARVLMVVPWAYQAFASEIHSVRSALVEGGLGEEDALILIDFIADLTISTNIQVGALRAAWSPEGGPVDPRLRTGVGAAHDRVANGTAARAIPSALLPNAELLDRGWLDRKIDIVIAGVDAGTGNRPKAVGEVDRSPQ
ncbi:TetR/AcrR family transcriptional regulator [Schaalia sp. 19OD2882]|uniref:TetR/AcrR family transcriptional regulator n=1 Tax=Schaalia sp. 19OD2882 TaxID=2794089 RepID=UPI001C1EDD2A|nr:TetR/AcrR family transcriptional regulator [Schaalia sp. 19OD2882]QWW20252.1 TetR/AcrR family transcriptional regulator [Schaalia sp. 19OD2882]